MKVSWTETEKKVWHLLSFGGIADLCPAENISFDNIEDWGDDRTIRAIFLKQLCTVPDFISKLQPHGIRLRCCKIDGLLELESLNIPLNLSLRQCLIADINLMNSTVKSIDFSGSITGRIDADSLTVLGNMRLAGGFIAKGPVCLMGTIIKGDLICTRGCFNNQNIHEKNTEIVCGGVSGSRTNCGDCRNITLYNYSLVLERSKIHGSLYLCDEFSALGGVHLGDSTIDGNLNCSNGRFSKITAITIRKETRTGRRLSCYSETELHRACAFNGEGLHVKRNMLINNINVEGEMRLTGAYIEGDLDSAGAKFKNINSNAIYGDRLYVKGNVFFCDNFQAEGILRLPMARIGADLSFYKASINLGDGEDVDLPVLNCEGIKINGSFFLKNLENKRGYINLSYATIGGNLDCSNSQFLYAGKHSIKAQGMNVAGSLFMCTKKEERSSDTEEKYFIAKAPIYLDGSKIGMDLIFTKGRFNSTDSNSAGKCSSIWANNMNIGGKADLDDIEATFGIRLNYTKIGGNLDFGGSKIHAISKSRDDMAIAAGKVNVGGSIYLDNEFKAEGEVMLNDAIIGRNLVLNQGLIENKGDFTLSAVQMKVNGSIKMNKFKSCGEIKINYSVVGGNIECLGCTFHNVEQKTDRRKEESTPDDESEKNFTFMAIGAKTEGSVWFQDADIIGVVSFQRASIGREFLWRRIKNRANFSLFMDAATVGVLSDDCDSWPENGNLQVNDFIYQFLKQVDDPEAVKQRLEKWLSLSKHFRTQPYEHLAAVLKKSGHEEEAKLVLIKKNNRQNSIKQSRIMEFFAPHLEKLYLKLRKSWNWVYCVLAGYGYKPFRAIWIGLVIILAGAFLFKLGFDQKLMVQSEYKGGYQVISVKDNNNVKINYPNNNHSITNWDGDKHQILNIADDKYNDCGSESRVTITGSKFVYYLIYSLDTFIPLIDFQTANYWLPSAYKRIESNENCSWQISKFGRFLCIFRWIMIISGWIITSVFVAALSGIVRK